MKYLLSFTSIKVQNLLPHVYQVEIIKKKIHNHKYCRITFRRMKLNFRYCVNIFQLYYNLLPITHLNVTFISRT